MTLLAFPPAQVIANNEGVAGPLPIAIPFTLDGGYKRILVIVTGTALKLNAAGFMHIAINVDGANQLDHLTYTNSFGVHWTMSAILYTLAGLAAGSHTLNIKTNDVNTSSDANDVYSALIMELPT